MATCYTAIGIDRYSNTVWSTKQAQCTFFGFRVHVAQKRIYNFFFQKPLQLGMLLHQEYQIPYKPLASMIYSYTHSRTI